MADATVPSGTPRENDPDSVLALKRFYAAEIEQRRALAEGRDDDADKAHARQQRHVGDLANAQGGGLLDVENKLHGATRQLLAAVTSPGSGAAQNALVLVVGALLDTMAQRFEEGR